MEATSEQAPSPREVLTRLQALESAHDDLHDQFRRFRGRMTKRMSVDESDREAAPADGAAVPPSARNGKLPRIAELRAAGRWPIR